MRIELVLTVENKNAVIKEITPMDFLTAIEFLLLANKLTMAQTEPSDWIHCWLTQGLIVFDRDDTQQAELVINHFYQLNHAFFGDKKNTTGSYAEKTTDGTALKRLASELRTACALLATHHHTHCWNYGFAYFQTIQKLHSKKQT